MATTRSFLVPSTLCSLNFHSATNPHTLHNPMLRIRLFLLSSLNSTHFRPNSLLTFPPISFLSSYSSSSPSYSSSSLNRPTRVFSMAGKDPTFTSSSSSSSSSSHQSKFTNRLALEHSPYLLQHAHNPVNWYPWGDEAFEEARTRDMPIFLSIGYSTCHWCHVMEEESFENDEVAQLLNDGFISIKVDREERPDVDKVYMTYVQALYGSGGWPLSIFLSPDLKPLMGGTYFHPDDKNGKPGLKTILRKVKEAWVDKKGVLLKSGTYAIEQLTESLSISKLSDKLSEEIAHNALFKCTQTLAENYDPKYGGFASAPKFPRPAEPQSMIHQSKKLMELGKTGEAEKLLKMVAFNLQCMARGGVHDHVGGGFHRYSVDECWHVPHFEKMLYDQGQLANVYLDVFCMTKDVFYSCVARDILDYLKRDMIGPNGEIFSAEDADSADPQNPKKKKEGAFYVWTTNEIEDILGEHASLFKEHYYIKKSGNCDLSSVSDPHNEFKGKNVLIERKSSNEMASKLGLPLEKYQEILGVSRKKLFDARSKRPRPQLDDKVIVSWNGLAISSFARASKILKTEPQDTKSYFPVSGTNPQEYMEVAKKALAFIKQNLYNPQSGRLQHSFRNGPSKAPGFLDDYAFLIAGLLDVYEYGGETCWLSWAVELQETQDEAFLDKSGGGYFNTTGEDVSVLLRLKEDHDGAEPSGNSVTALNLVRLAAMFTGSRSDRYRQNAEHLLAVFEKRLNEAPVAVPLMCCAADMLSNPSKKQVVLVGKKSSPEMEQMLVSVHASYDPSKFVIHVDPSDEEEMEFWKEMNPNVAAMAMSSFVIDSAVALVCRDFACKAPVTDPKSLEALILSGKA